MAGILSLAGSIVGSQGGFLKDADSAVYLQPMTRDGTVDAGKVRSFQFWPADLQDDYGIQYANKQIPGSNLPFYQWISGGEHQLSFTAYFSSDLLWPAGAVKEDHYNVDVAAAVKWLRSLCVPNYVKGQDFAEPPPMLVLVVPNTPIGMDMSDHMNCLMTQCNVQWRKWFHDGTPRLAQVSLTFVETVQIVGGRGVQFYGRDQSPSWEGRYKYAKGSSTK